jgi:hypothetical protein
VWLFGRITCTPTQLSTRFAGLEITSSDLWAGRSTPRSSSTSSLRPPAGKRRVVGLMLDRVFGRPKETVDHQTEMSEAERALRELAPEQPLTLWRNRGLHVVDDKGKEGPSRAQAARLEGRVRPA